MALKMDEYAPLHTLSTKAALTSRINMYTEKKHLIKDVNLF